MGKRIICFTRIFWPHLCRFKWSCCFDVVKYIDINVKKKNLSSHTESLFSFLGVRLYFTTSSFNNPFGEPYLLKLIHIRMPPGFAPSLASQKPGNIHAAFYRKGNKINSTLHYCVQHTAYYCLVWLSTVIIEFLWLKSHCSWHQLY